MGLSQVDRMVALSATVLVRDWAITVRPQSPTVHQVSSSMTTPRATPRKSPHGSGKRSVAPSRLTSACSGRRAVICYASFTSCARPAAAEPQIRLGGPKDGSAYGSRKDVAAWKEKSAAPKGIVQVSKASLGIRIEPNDPNGKYLVEAKVRDIRGGVTIELEQPFSVSD
jgi:hypothetical protein